MSDYKKNIVSSLIFLILGIGLMVLIPISIPLSTEMEVGPRAFPYFIAVSMILLSVLLLASTLFQYRKQRPQQDAEKEPSYMRDEIRALVLCGIILLYVFLFDKMVDCKIKLNT
ncbi:MAG: hypothetical protein ACFWUC_06190 [Oscillospiraceae bacterium]|jgi:putative tricarboxylic transport membrane protein